MLTPFVLEASGISAPAIMLICCHYAYLLPSRSSAAIMIICCHYAHLLPVCSSAAMHAQALACPKEVFSKIPHCTTGSPCKQAKCLQRLCCCIFRMMCKVATAAFTSLLVHKSIAFVYMFWSLQTSRVLHVVANVDVTVCIPKQTA